MSHEPHPWDDETVSRLPIGAGRAELLEDIMSTPVDDRSPVTEDAARRTAGRPWLVPLAVAAAVALLVAGPLWWASSVGPGRDAGSGGFAGGPDPDAAADLMVLDAPGWTVVYTTDGGEYGTSVRYERGGASLEIDGYSSEDYDTYVRDRRHISDPPSDGEPVEVVGETGAMWAYGAQDHTVIRPVEGDLFYEARGDGMGEAAFVDLLGSLRLVDHDTFDAMLPPAFVDDAERPAAVQEMLDGIGAVTDPVLPPGDDGAVGSEQSDPYQLGADVAGQVACRWFGAYVRAREAGDEVAARAAADTMATSRDWPVLQDMDAEGDFPEVVWDLSDQVVDGRRPVGYEQALGCTG